MDVYLKTVDIVISSESVHHTEPKNTCILLRLQIHDSRDRVRILPQIAAIRREGI